MSDFSLWENMLIHLQPEAVGIHLPLQEVIALADRYGYEGINLPLSSIGKGRESMSLEQIEAMMADAGLKFGSFGAPSDYTVDQATYNQRMEELRGWLPIAQRLGCDRATSVVRPVQQRA